MSQTESAKAVQMQERVALYRQQYTAANRWAAGYGGDLAAQGYCAIASKVAVGVCNSRTAGDVLRT